LSTNDHNLQELLSSRLQEAEMPVADHLWAGIESRIPSSAATSPGSVTSPWAAQALKWVAGAVAVGMAALVTIFVLNTNESADPAHQPVRQETAPAATEVPAAAATVAAPPVSDPAPVTGEQILPTANSASTGTHTTDQAPNHAPGPDRPVTVVPVTGPMPRSQAGTSGASVGPGTPTMPQASPVPVHEWTAAFNPRPVDEGQLRWFFIPVEDRAAAYNWNFGDGSQSDVMAGVHTYQEEGTFEVTLVITTADGTTRTETKSIEVWRPVELHPVNVFTPNGDGKNDTFDPLFRSTGILEAVELIILDPANRVVFNGTSGFVWDGLNPAGDACSDATYRFVLRAVDNRGNPVEKTGLVRLMR